jgi:hypothetical protein
MKIENWEWHWLDLEGITGRRDLVIIEAIYKAATTGKKVEVEG